MSKCIEHKQNGKGVRYGLTRVGGKSVAMHRLAYCFARGINLDMIKGSSIRHTCDNVKCINPQHLILGTHQDNMEDRQARQRQAKGTVVGNAVLDADKVRFIRANYVKYSKEWGYSAIARMLGVSPTTVRSVIDGRCWGHLE